MPLSPNARRALRVGATLLVLGLCGWAASRLDLRGAARVLVHARLGWLLLACALNLPFILLQTVRWRLLLTPVGRAPLLSLFRYLLASRAASNLLPARAGELLRIYLPHRRDGLPVVALASIVVLERFFDAFGLAAVSAPLLILPRSPEWVRTGMLVLLGAGLVGAAVVAVFAVRGAGAGKGVIDRIGQLAAGLRRPTITGAVLGITLLCWLTELCMVQTSLLAVGLPPSWAVAMLVLLAVNLGMLLQVTPGNLGPFEASVLLALAALEVTGPRATAAAVLYHLVVMVPVTLAGLEGLRFVGEARRAELAPDTNPMANSGQPR